MENEMDCVALLAYTEDLENDFKELKMKYNDAIDTLKKIEDPGGYIRNTLKEDEVLDVDMIFKMESDPNYFKSVASKFLERQRWELS